MDYDRLPRQGAHSATPPKRREEPMEASLCTPSDLAFVPVPLKHSITVYHNACVNSVLSEANLICFSCSLTANQHYSISPYHQQCTTFRISVALGCCTGSSLPWSVVVRSSDCELRTRMRRVVRSLEGTVRKLEIRNESM